MSNHKSVEERRTQAKERQEAFSRLNNFQRLDLLDARLGKGVGAVKQRAKLLAEIAEHGTKTANEKVVAERKSKKA